MIKKKTERKKAGSLSDLRTPEHKDDETAAGKTGGNFSGLSQASGDLREGVSYDEKNQRVGVAKGQLEDKEFELKKGFEDIPQLFGY